MEPYKPIPQSQVSNIVRDMRHDILRMVHNCGKQNGHLGGCMSVVELLAVLYTQIMNINEVAHSDKEWALRDRFIMSKGHAGIAMYAAMKHVGLLSQEMINGPVRGENTVIYRHPKRNIEYGIECSVGSLGMGIGYGIGLAESFRRKGTGQQVYVMVGDGECDEGSVWESAAYAGHRKLENLTVIIDKNNLQLDGLTHEVLAMDNMAERWKAFGFQTIEIDGHNIEAIHNAFRTAHKGQPLAVIAHTVKGKGVSFAENRVEWHDNYLSDALYEQGMEELGDTDLSEVQRLARDRFLSRRINMSGNKNKDLIRLPDTKEQLDHWHSFGSKNVIGEVSLQLAEQDEQYTLIYSDCANRIGIKHLQEIYPEKCYETGISEQNQIAMAAAMSQEGFHVIAIAYAPFITARVLDQIRANLGYMKSPVCLIGLGAGLAGSDLGATHTAFEDIANLRCIPDMAVSTPADTYEIAKAMEAYCNNPKSQYLRVTIADGDPKVNNEPCEYKESGNRCLQEGRDFAVLACGSIISETMNAVSKLRDLGYIPTVYSVHSVKPMDKRMIESIQNSRIVFTIEEHSVIGGFGSSISELFSERPGYPLVKRIGIQDCYFYADTPGALREKCGIDADGIVGKIKEALREMGI